MTDQPMLIATERDDHVDVWRRSPGGAIEQVARFAGSGALDAASLVTFVADTADRLGWGNGTHPTAGVHPASESTATAVGSASGTPRPTPAAAGKSGAVAAGWYPEADTDGVLATLARVRHPVNVNELWLAMGRVNTPNGNRRQLLRRILAGLVRRGDVVESLHPRPRGAPVTKWRLVGASDAVAVTPTHPAARGTVKPSRATKTAPDDYRRRPRISRAAARARDDGIVGLLAAADEPLTTPEICERLGMRGNHEDLAKTRSVLQRLARERRVRVVGGHGRPGIPNRWVSTTVEPPAPAVELPRDVGDVAATVPGPDTWNGHPAEPPAVAP